MSYSLKFIIRDDKPSKIGLCPIYLRYTFNRKFKNISTGYNISTDYWDKIQGEPTSKYKDKEKIIPVITKLKGKVQSLVNDFRLYEERFPTVEELIEKINKGKLENEGLEILYKEFIEFKSGKYVENSTVRVYNDTWKKWTDFETLTNKKYTIRDLNIKTLDEFRSFLISLELQPNSVGKFIKTMKSFIKVLQVYKKLDVPIDYKEVKVDRKDGQFEVFTKKEIEILKKSVVFSHYEKIEIGEDYLNPYKLTEEESLVGRIMVFLCSTGLSYVDFLRLTINDIIIEEKEYDTNRGINIKITRQKLKSNDVCVIPILEDTLDNLWVEIGGIKSSYRTYGGFSFDEKIDIFKNYLKIIGKDETGNLKSYLFPQYPKLFRYVPNQTFNNEIKKVCQKIGMDTKVKVVKTIKNKIVEEIVPKYTRISSHTGRRTYITMSLDQNIRPDIVMKTTGQKKFDTLKKYTKITDKYINKEYTQKVKTRPDEQI